MKAKLKTKKKSNALKGENNTISWVFFFSAITISFLFLLIANDLNQKTYSIFNRTWGFDHVEYFHSYFKSVLFIILFSGIILFSTSRVYNAIYRWTTKVLNTISEFRPGRYKIALFLIVSVIAGTVFYLVRIKYVFLGDFDIRMNSTVEGDFHNHSYLTMLLLNKIFHLLNKSFEVSAQTTFIFASVISGGIYTFFTLLIADLLGSRAWQKLVIALFCLGSGSVFIFTGYVEIYPIPALVLLINLYVSLLYIKDKAHFIFVVLTFIIGVGMHLMSVALLPGIVFILVYKNHKRFSFLSLKRSQIILIVLASLPFIYFLANRLGLISLTPLKESSYYTLFSIEHIWELINSQILASGLSFFLFLFVLYTFLRKGIEENLLIYFLLIQSVYYFFIIFILNKMRGSTDCDITSFPSFIYNILIVYIFVHQLITKVSKKDIFYILSFTILFNTINASLWIGITSSDKSIDKIADMIGNDPASYYTNSMPPELLLAMIYANNDLVPDAIRYYEKSYKASYNDPRSHYNYATYLINHEQEINGIQVLKNLTDMFPNYPLSYPILINYYQNQKDYQNLYSTALNMFEGFKMNPQSFDRIDKSFNISVFNYLYEMSENLNNTNLRNELATVLAKLNN